MDAYWKTPSLYKRYLERLNDVLSETFTEERLYPRIDQLAEGLEEVGTEDFNHWGKKGGARSWQHSVKNVKTFIKRRRAFLQKELRKLN
jgi:hypothetical protein